MTNCHRCAYAEPSKRRRGESALIDQCDACKREDAIEHGSLEIDGRTHIVRVEQDTERVIDNCGPRECNGRVYVE